MGMSKRGYLLSLLWVAGLVHSAVDLNGEQVVDPVTAKDPSPISDSETYYPEQHDCPLPCDDYSNINSWTPYFSTARLQRCEQPMLLKFSISQLLDDPKTTVLLRTCTIGNSSVPATSVNGTGTAAEVDNPKKANDLFAPSLDLAPACFVPGKEVQTTLELLTGGGRGSGSSASQILGGVQSFFNDADNCDEKFAIAYHKGMVAGVYIGAGLGKTTIKSVVQNLSKAPITSDRTVAQVCDKDRGAARALGVSIDTTGNIVGVQKDLLAWSQGTCIADTSLRRNGETSSIAVFDIAQTGVNSTTSSIGNSTTSASGTSSVSKGSSTISNSITSSLSSGSIVSSGSTASSGITTSPKISSTLSTAPLPSRGSRRLRRSDSELLDKRATCRYVKVESGDGCDSLAKKCGISGADFMKYNSQSNYCSTLKPGDYACCSSGDRYTEPKPPAPSPSADGTCATHLIADGDNCDSLAKANGITTTDIENFNKKTWAWTECRSMLVGYNMCLSSGYPPLPPPQQGAECGPIVPGTTQPSDRSINMADLNPCPLKACCSNWGFCGPFPAHCDLHPPANGGGPGAKAPGSAATCISNCGNEIKQNSGPPTNFNRIGYYESWNMERSCLWLNAKDANTDGTYTHMHWGFANIDPNTWKPVINDTFKQWSDFKALSVKRIVSLGGWAYSTEPATYNIIRRAIIDNRETFASNLAQFVKDEGIDGVDIDWEYPGAPDIYVNGQPIGQKGDGVAYLRFLTSLKQKLGSDKSVSIAAPASYWYLKAFPIDRIAAAIDYIVYMTYDLHGQWDYGNVNAYDSCPSGKCIRSHVNLTETRNSLSIITKAGVPNNKIFVGESSYGRSFHMAQNGCWGPMCDFTGSRTQSDATPGRCTNTKGYISNAEINEIKASGQAQWFHDDASNSDIMLYNGDYVSFMTPTTKDTRRADWKAMNFGGSIDWAVDLQEFRLTDFNAAPGNQPAGAEGCVSGRAININAGELCDFSCSFDFCPPSLCVCRVQGTIEELPPVDNFYSDVIAHDEFDADLNRLCKFACTHGFCPADTCTKPVIDEDENGDAIGPYDQIRKDLQEKCVFYRRPPYSDSNALQCEAYCRPQTDDAKSQGRTTNYGCMAFQEGDGPLRWQKLPGQSYEFLPGKCLCDNMFLNEIADFVIEALPALAQIGCFIMMSALKLVLDVGLELFGGGRVLSVGLDAAATAVQTLNYVYPSDQDPKGAFEWWLSPCGGSDLVPDDLKKAFDIMSNVASAGTSFKVPKKIGKGSGRKGDSGNPTDRSKPRSMNPGGTGAKGKKCRIKPNEATMRLGYGRNTLRRQSCVANRTKKDELVVTSLAYEPKANPLRVGAHCDAKWQHACYHYSSVIKNNPAWATMTCPPSAATTNHRDGGPVVTSYYSAHSKAWRKESDRAVKKCDADEFPPAYFLETTDTAFVRSGKDTSGQLVRYLPAKDNRGVASTWRSQCFRPPLAIMSDSDFLRKYGGSKINPGKAKDGTKQDWFAFSVSSRPEFSFTSWGQPAAADDGMSLNPCWPKKLAPNDPGFALMRYDQWYNGKTVLNYKVPP